MVSVEPDNRINHIIKSLTFSREKSNKWQGVCTASAGQPSLVLLTGSGGDAVCYSTSAHGLFTKCIIVH